MPGRERVLYEKQELVQTESKLQLLANDPSGTYNKVAEALKDERLIDALEDILQPYVIYGVVRDFERLRNTNALFDARIPELYEVLPLGGAQPTYKKPIKTAFKNDAKKKEEAYSLYFALYIESDAVEQTHTNPRTTVSGVEAFYMRYPLLKHAVKKVTANYYENIKLACDHIVKDWGDIKTAFFPKRNIQKLVRIQTTGNDFHKGGKQVLILHFEQEGDARVVYKPSPVEIDCRIVGDSETVNSIAPDRYFQETSLTELINRYVAKRREDEGSTKLNYAPRYLPTYKILPYNRTSVPNAYGYIEFLTHEPEPNPKIRLRIKEDIPPAVGAFVPSLSKAEVLDSDWIVNDARDEQVFYHAFGGLMAMALAVSLCDLHQQNVIVHKRLPHLIDLEEALKRPMTAVKDTYLHDALDCAYDPGSPTFMISGVPIFLPYPKSSDLTCVWQPGEFSSPSTAVLYRWAGTTKAGTLVQASEGANHQALVRGFIEVIETIATDPCNAKVKRWVTELHNTIARFVTRGTALYADSGRTLYQAFLEQAFPSQPTDYDRVKFLPIGANQEVFFFRGAVIERRKEWSRGVDGGEPWSTLPVFACEHPDHAWRDYLNCDVPSFYHRLGDLDLLNTKGDVVNVATAYAWQNNRNNLQLPADVRTLRLGRGPNYLPEIPTERICKQLDDLKQAFVKARGEHRYLRAALKGILEPNVIEGLVDKLGWERFPPPGANA
jgi:Domain of unknown function (DUF4135)